MSNTSLLGSYGDNSGAGLMFRNLLINGSCAIDQRNAGANQTITAGAALAYTVDRWYAYCTGANVTGARVAASGAYQFTGAASVTAIGFAQRIEAANCQHLAGGNATLSVDLSNSLLTTVTWTAYYANSTDAFGTLASPTRTQIATGTFTVSSTVTRYSATFAVPSAATTGIEIVFTVGAQTSGTWRINNAMLEAGPTATPFERRPIGVETALCYSYYYRMDTSTSSVRCFGIGSVSATTFAYIHIYIPPMRQYFSFGSSAASSFEVRSGGAYFVCNGLSTSSRDGLTHIVLSATTTGLTIGRACELTSSNYGWIDFSAEL
jgi:hypothetical protein